MTRSVLEWLENISKDYPNKIAFKDSNKSILFSELVNDAKRIGSALHEVKGGDAIAVLGSRKVETIEAFLGIVYSGHIYAPIDADLPDDRIKTLLSILEPAAIITDGCYEKRIRGFVENTDVYTIESALNSDIEDEYLEKIRKRMTSSDPLYVIFTSGSSGRPKGVVTSHYSLMCYIESYASVMGICSDDIIGNQSPLDYIAAIRDIYLPLYTGATSVIIPKELFMEPNRLFDFMNNNGITAVGWSVSALTIPLRLGAFEDVKLFTLKKICFSGSIMPASYLRIWQNNIPDALFVNQYGPTEATASCTYYIVDHKVEPDEKLPIGKNYNNYRVFLVNEDLSPTESGKVGEICVSGPALALGYYNDIDRTERSFISNPNVKNYLERMYRTGDYGRFRDDGMLEYHGRKDRQIKHLGHRIELDEVEYAAFKINGVEECLATYDNETEILSLAYSGSIEKKELVSGLRKLLPGFMVPRRIIKLEVLPKLSNGKTDMDALNKAISGKYVC